MKKLLAVVLCAAFAAVSFTASAGVAPTTGGSQMSQSGAKIAPPKPAAEEKKENQEENKEQSK